MESEFSLDSRLRETRKVSAKVRTVSGVAREAAHCFYLKHGMRFEAKYFSIDV